MYKKYKYGTTSVIDVFLIVGILVLVNIFSIGSFKRVDLTENREYTISTATKKILSELDDIVNVKVFMSSELPPEFLSLDRQIRDMLEEFDAYANSNFRLKFIDPKEEPKYRQEAEMAEIPEVSFQVVKEDQVQMMKAYLGILIEHENKTESIPFVSGVDNLEYDLMSRIVKVLQKENDLPTVGILQGHGEPGTQQANQQTQTPPGEMALFVEAIRKQFKAWDVNLENRDKVPSTVNTLVVVNPGSIPDYQIWVIDQFVMGGGKLICMISGMGGVDNLNEPPERFNSGLSDLLANWGVKINNDLVLDQKCETAQFRTGAYSMIRKTYPFWIRIEKENFNADNPITSSLESATFHWPSSIEILKDKLEGITVTELVKSSDKSWLMKKDFNTSPMQDFNVLPDGEQFVLGALISGNFTSYFSGKERPLKPSDGKPAGGTEPFKEKSAETDIIVFTSGQLPLNNLWNQRGGSLEVQNLLLNTLDYLNIGDELIGIRSRHATNRPLDSEKIETESQRRIIRALNLFAVPLLVILIGVIRFVLKAGRKKRFEKELSSKE